MAPERVLLLTVGGSPEPLKTAIESLNPKRCIFVHTSESEEKALQVVEETGVQAELVYLDDPDDPAEVYDRIFRRLLAEVREGHQVHVDYTGGTKTMSAAALMAASDLDIEVHVTTGERKDATQINSGESTRKIDKSGVIHHRFLALHLPPLVESYLYGPLERSVRHLGAEHPAPDREVFDVLVALVSGFAAWDRFDHDRAVNMFRSHKKMLGARWSFLCNARQERRWLESRQSASPVQTKEHESEEQAEDSDECSEVVSSQRPPRQVGWLVADLLRNAKRKAKAGLFDDAVGRMYRALELMAQLLLAARHDIDTGKVDLFELARRGDSVDQEILREMIASNKGQTTAKVGLLDSWRLLAALGDEEGRAFLERENEMRTALEKRNLSLFAHGFTPIDKTGWKVVKKTIGGFLEEILAAQGLTDDLWPQFPKKPAWFEEALGLRAAPTEESPSDS
ncbi:MAG: hypothetical protein KatS3mg008_1296 [Acidimicrobiales bacterium]|nr:MAG: hypothetical protein KatS3mg008_1296 [Acidimicrobiales bacterium]